MNFSNYRFTLDIQKSKTQASLPVHFGDTGNRFYITLTDGGNPYIIGDGCRVDICIKKPNGVPLINTCIIENSALVRYDFNKNTASVEGIHKCELRLYSPEGRLITTPYFIMVVDQNIFYDDEIGTDEDFQKIIALDVIAKEEERRIAEFERWEAEELRALAEKNRVAAEESRDEAENVRKEAEVARALAENARVEAENERGQELSTIKQYVEENIPDLSERIATSEGKINEHSNQISNHEERISSNDDGIRRNTERIDSHEASINTHSTQINARDTQISNHEERITGIERYLGGDNFIVDDSTAYEKTVPKNACEKAKVLSIGGMTYKKRTDEGNLLPYPYHGIGGASHTEDKGAITVNGDNDTVDFIISANDVTVYPAGTYIFEVGEQRSDEVINVGLQFYGTAPTVLHLSNSKCQITATSSFVVSQYLVVIEVGATVTLYPMLYKADTPITWQPRGDWLSHTKVKSIESKGANLFDISNAIAQNCDIDNGVVKQNVADSARYFVFKIQKVLNNVYQGEISAKEVLGKGTVVFPFVKDPSFDGIAFGLNGNVYDTMLNTTIPNMINGNTYYLAFDVTNLVQGSVSWENIIVSKENVPYTPYVGTIDTFTIPEEVRNREGYGLGVSEDDYNYIERTEGGRWLLHERSGCVDMGTLDWLRGSIANDGVSCTMHCMVPGMKPSSAVILPEFSQRFDCLYWEDLNGGEMMTTWDSIIVLAVKGYGSGTDFKAAMAGVMLYYALAEPIVTDITDLMPKENLIKVLGGCRIVAENEQSDPVPFSIKYLVTYPKEAN